MRGETGLRATARLWASEKSNHLKMRIGKFSVSWYPLWKITIRFTWNSILNSSWMYVAHEYEFGKSM